MKVPNQFPTGPSNGIALVGEAPGVDEDRAGKPFVGPSGQFLNEFLGVHRIDRARCFLGNVAQVLPPENPRTKKPDMALLPGEERAEGLQALQKDLAQFDPNVVVLMGKWALHAAKSVWNIGDFRGSLFESSFLLGAGGRPLKCIATYHPAYCLRQYEGTPLLMMDLGRAKQEALTRELVLPQRKLVVDATPEEMLRFLGTLPDLVACDIEGGVDRIPCVSFAPSAEESWTIPFYKLDGTPCWDLVTQESLWLAVKRTFENSHIGKVWQNGLYDRFVLGRHEVNVRGNRADTMLQWWEWQNELEKSLGFQASILTREPFYKADISSDDQDTFYRYCARDSAVTYEIHTKLNGLLKPSQEQHYKFNHDLLDPLLYIQNRGIRYNETLARERLEGVSNHVFEWQFRLDREAHGLSVVKSIPFDGGNSEVYRLAVELVCKSSRKGGVKTYKEDQPKKDFAQAWTRWQARLADSTPLTETERGELSTYLDLHMNTKSPKFKEFLYKTCGLPTQWKKDPKTGESRPTTDYEALLKLSRDHDHPALKCALELSRLRTRVQMLGMVPFKGRMHCSTNVVGSESGRITCRKSNLYA